jgi:hypothetical protein
MTETPLFEVIPPKPKTREELLAIIGYLNGRCLTAEARLYELSDIIKTEDSDNGSPYRGWNFAYDRIRDWERYDEENPE